MEARPPSRPAATVGIRRKTLNGNVYLMDVALSDVEENWRASDV
jgi:hypothetical protein